MKTIAVVPVYNEAPNVIGVLNELEPLVDKILIIDDGSEDGSEVVIEDWLAGAHDAELITLDHHRGMSPAILAGYALIERWRQEKVLDDEDIVVKIDSDGQHKPDDLPALLAYLIDNNLDSVRARRSFDKYPGYKRLGNRLMSGAVSILAGQRFHDVESGYCLDRARVLKDILSYATAYRYSLADEIAVILPRRGFKISNEPVAEVPLFQSHTRFRDVAINLVISLVALIRVEFDIKTAGNRESVIAEHIHSAPKRKAS